MRMNNSAIGGTWEELERELFTPEEIAASDLRVALIGEWARAFRANSWAEVNSIENAGVKEAAKTMQVIMANPTEREMIRMRNDAEIDWRTQINAAKRQMAKEIASGMKLDGVDPAVISKYSGLTLEEIHAL